MKKITKYLITLAVGLVIAVGVMWVRDIFNQTELSEIYLILCDSFFVSGVFITAAGALVFSSNEGTFDAIVYGCSTFIDMFRRHSKKKYDTLFDYRESRADKKIQFGFILITGIFLLAISVVMYLLYRNYV